MTGAGSSHLAGSTCTRHTGHLSCPRSKPCTLRLPPGLHVLREPPTTNHEHNCQGAGMTAALTATRRISMPLAQDVPLDVVAAVAAADPASDMTAQASANAQPGSILNRVSAVAERLPSGAQSRVNYHHLSLPTLAEYNFRGLEVRAFPSSARIRRSSAATRSVLLLVASRTLPGHLSGEYGAWLVFVVQPPPASPSATRQHHSAWCPPPTTEFALRRLVPRVRAPNSAHRL